MPLVAAFLLGACGGSPGPELDKGGPSPSPGDGSSENVAVEEAVTAVSLERVWLGAAVMEGKCHAQHAKMTYDRVTHEATWHVCRDDAYVDRARSLTDEEVATIESQLGSITYQANPPCEGYDGLYMTMTVSRVDGTSLTYARQNINCYGYPKAEGLGAPFDFLLSKM